MALPNMTQPAEAATAHELTYTDGTKRTVFVTEREIAYPEGRLIISRTDLDGVITHANDAFVELSGYQKEELIGQPHSILRHPDMPKAAFKDLSACVACDIKVAAVVLCLLAYSAVSG